MPPDAASAGGDALRAIEFKGRMMLVSILRLHTTEAAELDAALGARMAEAPDLMRDMPVVVDLEALGPVPFPDLLVAIEHVRRHGFKLIGIHQGEAASEPLAEASGLPSLVLSAKAEVTPRPKPAEPAAPEPPQAPAAVPAAHTPTRLVTQPVRSGQQIYARGGDLIVTGAVSAGAEVLADGHIHVYGTLRGRALAGVRGLVSAHIFCRRMDAELVSIGGHYRIAEDILDRERGENRLVTLSGETIHILEI
ncbi:septum site-determining protein MinC [Thioalkalivibrio sp.]|uniref:septum site-determining protein MinC n=1 Tax=Thioalkalivibrio sp. TaxID=2093813 RepID=UPI0039754B55